MLADADEERLAMRDGIQRRRRSMSVDLEAMARTLEESGDYRVLRRIGAPDLLGPASAVPGLQNGIILDCETTGLDPQAAHVIELAMLRFEYDERGIGRTLRTFSGLHAPPCPIPPEVTTITGIHDADVAGMSIDDHEVNAFVAGADVVIAHNSSFDRRFVERRWPVFAQLAWGCSLTQVPWREEGFEAAKLKSLLAEAGYFHRGHRALDDAAATLHLLGIRLPRSGRRGFEHVLDRTLTPSERVWALGAPFAAKDVLKARGFRWSDGSAGTPRAWNVDLPTEAARCELRFLAENVYRGPSPAVAVQVTAYDRFTARAGML